jgi:hypothetical protein
MLPVVARINAFEEQMQAEPEEALRARRAAWQEQLRPIEDETALAAALEEILPEAFAVVKNAARRLCGTTIDRLRPAADLGHGPLRRAAHRRHRPAPRARSPRWRPARARPSSPPCRSTSTPSPAAASTSSPSTTTSPAATPSGWALFKFLGLTVGCIQHDQPPDRAPRSSTPATSPTAPTASSASTTCATTAWPPPGGAGAARPLLRHRRRGGLHPHRRGAHAAHHQRPGHGPTSPVRPVQTRWSNSSSQADRCSATPLVTEAEGSCSTPAKPRRRASLLLFKVKLGQPRNKGLLRFMEEPEIRRLDEQGRAGASIRTRRRRNSSRSRRNSTSPSTKSSTRPTSPRRAASS